MNEQISAKKKKSKLDITSPKAILLLAIALLVAAFLWDYIKWNVMLFLIILFPVYFMIAGVFLVALLFSFQRSRFLIRKPNKLGYIALVVNIVTSIYLLLPVTGFHIELNHYLNYFPRAKVVEMIKSGELESRTSRNRFVDLPFMYSFTSGGGNVVVLENSEKRTEVFFFLFRGILDNFSGFVYTSDGYVTKEMGGFLSDVFDEKQFSDNWYWVTSQ